MPNPLELASLRAAILVADRWARKYRRRTNREASSAKATLLLLQRMEGVEDALAQIDLAMHQERIERGRLRRLSEDLQTIF